MPRTWTIDDAVTFLRSLQEALLPVGYHVGLTGSVLTKGESRKDLDVLIYPASTMRTDEKALKAALLDFGLFLIADRAKVEKVWRRAGSEDTKHVEVWAHGVRRVDLFFVT